jgi:hypothetical protein
MNVNRILDPASIATGQHRGHRQARSTAQPKNQPISLSQTGLA